MAGALHGVLASLKAAAASATDAFFRYVSLLLNTTSTNGAQNNTFLDGSTNAFSITRNGNTTQGTFSPFSQTGWSNYFDGTGDYLNIASSSAVNFGTGDFTVEFWVYPGAITRQDWFDTYSTGPARLLIYYSGTAVVYFNQGALITGGSITTGQWYHIALCRSSGSTKLFINGTQSGSTYSDTKNYGDDVVIIGKDGAGSTTITGYMSNVRVVKSAVYTANFTPPTAPLTAITNTSLLTCQSNRFIDNSSNAFAITRNGDVSVQAFSPFAPTAAWSASTNGGSGYFDGTGDFLSAPSSTAFQFGSGDFTIECWAYQKSTPNGSCLIAEEYTGVTSTNVAFTIGFCTTPGSVGGSLPFIGFWFFGGAWTGAAAAAAQPNNTWYHIAYVRSGSAHTMYINGVSSATFTYAGSMPTDSDSIYIGRRWDSGGTNNFFDGYISNARIVKGIAVYTANFTPPTAPLTAITNTSLLLNFTNAGIYDSASGNDLETVGNAQVSTVQAKWGTTSMAFDGTGDYLVVPDGQTLEFGAASFTIELWVNTTSSTQYAALYARGATFTAANGAYSILINNASATAGDVAFWAADYNLVTAIVTTTGVSIRDGAWHHIAVVRNGSSWAIYVDGVSRATNTSSVALTNATGSPHIGRDPSNSARDFNGYIDDLRITNGVARYTSNFTAPTAAFPLQ